MRICKITHRKGVSFFAAFLFSFLMFSQSSVGECNSKELKDAVLSLLKPDFKYDSSKIIRFEYTTTEQVKETEVPLFIGEKYRFLFNLNAAPLGAEVRVYDKPYDSKKRKLIYSTKQEKEGEKNIFIFEPVKSKKIYVDVVVPSTDKTFQRGCVVFVIGYKI